jgi:transposase
LNSVPDLVPALVLGLITMAATWQPTSVLLLAHLLDLPPSPSSQVIIDDQRLAVLRILADRRRSLGEDHTRMVSQLHQLLLELIPGGAHKSLSAAQAKALLARVRPRDAADKTRRRVAAELISDLERSCQRKKAANKELNALLATTGTTLTNLHGTGPSGAARLLVEVGEVTRFPTGAQARVATRGTGDKLSFPVAQAAVATHTFSPGDGLSVAADWA